MRKTGKDNLKSDFSKLSPNAAEKSSLERSPYSNPSSLRRVFDVCISKARANIRRLADEPKSAAWAVDGNYFNFPESFYDIGNWTASFFTGMALIAWQETEDEHFIEETLRLEPHYRQKVYTRWVDTHHDLGFLYSLYSVALYKLTGNTQHRDVGLRAAELLTQRFNSKGNFIRAWGRIGSDDPEFPANMAIIDSLMNLPLLFWASNETKQAKFYDIATQHANTVLKCFIRPDYSTFHAYRFDLHTGEPIGPDNACGAGTDSYWARGAAWAIYGFALSYSYTHDLKYLETALRLANNFIGQLDDQIVPIWDFRVPADTQPVRDASAAVIAACGIQELAKHGVGDANLLKTKHGLLERICNDDYIDFNTACPGILKNAYGDKRAYSSWGDYFLMEALARELFQFQPWW
jgi:unsaturated chondroitin disaccharide hydrolase